MCVTEGNTGADTGLFSAARWFPAAAAEAEQAEERLGSESRQQTATFPSRAASDEDEEEETEARGRRISNEILREASRHPDKSSLLRCDGGPLSAKC